jgi:hypothetical protein
MTTVLMEIGDVVRKKPMQVGLVQDGDVVQDLPSATENPALRERILPGRPVGRSNDFHTHVFQGSRYDLSVLPVAVEDHVPRRMVFRERFPELLNDPQGVGLGRDRELEDLSPRMVDDEKDLQDIERCRGDREEVHAGQAVFVVSQEGDPPLNLAGVRRFFRHVAADRALVYFKTQLEELGMYSWRAPGVIESHLSNELTDFFGNLRPSDSPAA